MATGEFAVHYMGFQPPPPSNITGPFCTVFSSLEEAEAHAAQQVQQYPKLLCRIYDHHGLSKQPLHEMRGSQFKGEHEITPRLRRWLGSFMFFGGIALFLYDWVFDFNLTWPATIGMRMIPFGLVLLATELFLVLKRRGSR